MREYRFQGNIRKSFISEPNHKGDRFAIVYHTGSQPPPLQINIIGTDGRTQSFDYDYLYLQDKSTDFDNLIKFLTECREVEKERAGG